MTETEKILRYLDLVINHLIHGDYEKIGGIMVIMFDESEMIQYETGEKILLDPEGNKLGAVSPEAVSEIFLLMDSFRYEWFNEEAVRLIIIKLQQTRAYYIYKGYGILYENYPWCKMEWMTRA